MAIGLQLNEGIETLQNDFSRQGFALLRRLISIADASMLERTHRRCLGRRVHVGFHKHATWTEHSFEDSRNVLAGLAHEATLKALVTGISRFSSIDDGHTQVWINRCLPGEYIPIHCDGQGDVQLVICLQTVPEQNSGGDLVMNKRPIQLLTGDAVVFRATSVPHGTQPYRGNKVGSSGYCRVTMIVRFFRSRSPLIR